MMNLEIVNVLRRCAFHANEGLRCLGTAYNGEAAIDFRVIRDLANTTAAKIEAEMAEVQADIDKMACDDGTLESRLRRTPARSSHFCLQCHQNWGSHNDDGSCVDDKEDDDGS